MPLCCILKSFVNRESVEHKDVIALFNRIDMKTFANIVLVCSVCLQ